MNMPPPLKILPYPKVHLFEAQQRIPIRFGFAKIIGDCVKCISPPTTCRDILTSMLLAKKWPDKYEKWGKDYPEYKEILLKYNEQIDLNSTVLLITNVKYPEPGLQKLWEIEDLVGTEKSQLIPTENPRSFVIIGYKKWQSSTVLLSFWAGCIRYFFGGKSTTNSVIPRLNPYLYDYKNKPFYAKINGKLNFKNIAKFLINQDYGHWKPEFLHGMGFFSYLETFKE